MSYTDQDFKTMQARQALHPEGVSCQNCIHENNCDYARNPDCQDTTAWILRR